MSVALTIEIRSGNAAFTDNPHAELRRLVLQCAGILETHIFDDYERRLLDINGNRVGCITWNIEEDA